MDRPIRRLDADSLYELVKGQGTGTWRIPQRRESGGLTSRVAAHQYRTVLGLLDQELAPAAAPARVLDWGSGAATFSYAIATAGHDVWATDYAVPPMAEFIAAHTGRFTFEKASHPTDLPYEDGFFDVVLSNGCLEHVSESGGNDLASLREIARILRPSGAFVCAHLPNEHSYIETVARALKRPLDKYFHFPLYAHTSLYSRTRVEDLAEQSGFEVERFEVYGAVPRNPLSLLPRSISDAGWFVDAVDGLDDVLAAHLGQYCQNFAWVGRKIDAR